MIRLAVAPLKKVASSRVVAIAATRGLATRKKLKASNLSPEVWNALPNFPEYDDEEPDKDPAVYRRGPVTSAHMVDVKNQGISMTDSATISAKGSVVHGSLGDLGNAAAAIPLEYLALLRPAAEGAAAIRTLTSSTAGKNKKNTKKGTILVYGASQPNGFAAAQLASSAGHAVVAVVDSEHSGNEDCMEAVKGLMAEPGTAVPEEYALCKKKFLDLVHNISTGNEGISNPSPSEYLADFKRLFLDYCLAYPDTRPAAVDASVLEFKYMEKERDNWDLNMQAYFSQYPPGAPPMDKAKLDAFFTTQQYQIFRDKFWQTTTATISGDETSFSAPHEVKKLFENPEPIPATTVYPGAGPFVPYSFNILKQAFPADTAVAAGGPILGAAIAMTPDLEIAYDKIAAAAAASGKKTSSKRAMGEALSFLTKNQRATLGAAASVAEAARRAGAPVVVMGGTIRGLDSVQTTKTDVDDALRAMDVDDNGESRLNYFVQLYRASDFPFYADYAVHRASEELAGPRQIIVAK
jgi:hypothetical protein